MNSIHDQFDLTVVMPCLNEEENIEIAYKEILAELGSGRLQILFVDDGSTDRTLALIKELAAADARVSYISFTRNFGIEAALCAGYRYAGRPWLLHLDADLQFPPAEAKTLMMRALDGYDAVFGLRVDRTDPWLRRAGSALNTFLARRVLGIEIPAGATMFRLVRTDLARRVVDLRLGSPYFLATLPQLTSAWTTVPTAHRPRERGTAKVSVRGLARHAVDLFTGHSYRPLTFAGMACLAAASMSVLAGVMAAADGLRMAVTMLALGGAAALISLGVMARYLVRIAMNQPRPPLYLIRETNVAVEPDDLLEPLNHLTSTQKGKAA